MLFNIDFGIYMEFTGFLMLLRAFDLHLINNLICSRPAIQQSSIGQLKIDSGPYVNG